jgi:hypothetical protein
VEYNGDGDGLRPCFLFFLFFDDGNDDDDPVVFVGGKLQSKSMFIRSSCSLPVASSRQAITSLIEGRLFGSPSQQLKIFKIINNNNSNGEKKTDIIILIIIKKKKKN